jgi:hypothetical protein
MVFLDTFLDDSALIKFYGATNVMLLPYLNMQQISNSILADSLGSDRVVVAAKFRYVLELIHSNKRCPEGLVKGRHAGSILVDTDEPSVAQMARALNYLVFNHKKWLLMEKRAHQRRHQTRWYNSAWALLQYIDFIREEKDIVTDKGVKFTREKTSVLQKTKRQVSVMSCGKVGCPRV